MLKKVSYNTIGHELTHLVQGMNGIPEGEKQCDIWTLARHQLFCDEAPTYLDLPRSIRDHWPDFAIPVHKLCIQAIEVWRSYRYYIRWREMELLELSRRTDSRPHQISLNLLA